MSTEHVVIKSANTQDPNGTLTFESSCNGYKFVIEYKDAPYTYVKFWFNKQSWEELKQMVDVVLSWED